MLRRIERLLLDLAVFAVIGLGVLITASVLLRITVNSGIPDTIVIVRELMVVAIVLPLAVATLERAHIVVEFLSNKMPTRVQDWLIVGGSIFGLFALSPLIFAGWRETVHTIESGAFFFGQLNLPKWPGRVIFLIGISFCWLRLLLMVIGDIRTIRSGGSVIKPTHEHEESV
ncbi:MAG: TRAP transporter small permease [Donghicola eburneus]|jgi:TRAP-type C4-dicarboxylate transport system permease small subunit|uniref:TRAP transporter small permease protein n=1 Tax=Tritonibacter litoralis TaxID=2662264 RepID=A0A843YQ75_9RHOB|nr:MULTISPECIES: TRAP transporter small permease [Rhodobacterales]MAX51693.1 TRAP transporter small permease [Methylophaga sp.]MCI5042979.1 TRAP transporter small permease [Donghicola eburneus]MQQ10737.1 TRAP transporter small permease subunit [Tritonibacter litoralis]|tara:strand:+ start:2647 stop:3162 length:516 start_codon:yes stop_codon:yes gene_type:complete